MIDTIFTDNQVFRPYKNSWAVEIWKKHEQMHWLEDEVPLGDDVAAWKNGKVSEDEKDFVTQILRMFTQSDVNVGSLYYKELIPSVKNNEIIKMMGGFANREGIHQNAYALLNDTLGLPEGDYAKFLEYKEMADKHEFMLDVDTSTKSGLALALAKATFNEGISLFASFVMLLNFRRRGLMTGMATIVEWSIKDENVHVEGLTKLFQVLCEQHPRIVNDEFKKKIYNMSRVVVELEDAFIDLAYASSHIEGLEKDEVKQYIRYIADRRLNQLGLKENFGIEKNPLSWLDWIVSGIQHTNFFENKVTDYSIAGLQGDWDYDDTEDKSADVEISSVMYVVYTKNDCPWCTKAKNLLNSNGLEYTEIDLSDYDRRQAFYSEKGFIGPQQTMPKIYKDGKLIGGCTDLMEHLK